MMSFSLLYVLSLEVLVSHLHGVYNIEYIPNQENVIKLQLSKLNQSYHISLSLTLTGNFE